MYLRVLVASTKVDDVFLKHQMDPRDWIITSLLWVTTIAGWIGCDTVV